MKIYLINKMEIDITQEEANIIRDRVKEGYGQFQFFSGSQNLVWAVNVQEIAYIG